MWQRKVLETTQQTDNSKEESLLLPVDITVLRQSHLFQDLLISLDLSIGEVNVHDNLINLGLLNWQVIDQDEISIANNLLSTPCLDTLSNEPRLKRQLWQCLSKHAIT